MNRIQIPEVLRKYFKELLLLLAVVLLWTVVSPLIFGRSAEVGMDYLDESMQIEMLGAQNPDPTEIRYADITGIETAQDTDLGEMVSGEQQRTLLYGTWKNDAYGEYFLAVDPRLHTYCVITAKSGVYVLNVQTKADTESFAKALRQLLLEKGYHVGP